MEFSKKTLKKLFSEEGAGKVEKEAIEEFDSLLENYAGYITEEAVAIASKNDRKVVKKHDIEKAIG
ncbi:MAG: NFYB/HAP3 family transcription factor subunit [Candidatus Nanohaloarchaeota archaeon QJJ-9]|nr:NFYB/HAP3 family transcription factor subunit [Candidatus Nanohaloarchaeota archaeon QJJ-9]